MKNVKVVFNGEECGVTLHKYANNGRTCIRLHMVETGKPMATATINIPETFISESEVAIKEWHGFPWRENGNMVEALISAGVILCPHRSVISGREMLQIALKADDIIEKKCDYCTQNRRKDAKEGEDAITKHGIHGTSKYCAECELHQWQIQTGEIEDDLCIRY